MIIRSSLLFLPLLLCPSTIQPASVQRGGPTKSRPTPLIAECVDDGFETVMPEYPARDRIVRIADTDIEAGFPTEEEGATFSFVRAGKKIFEFTLKDLDSRSVWIAVNHDQSRIALTYSDGGAIGSFHVRVFWMNGDGVKDLSKSIDPAVADFKSRHYCKARGNNVTGLKWVGDSLLLLTEVYPTGDCGPDLGHLEGYLVSVPEGEILNHLTLSQLKRYPGICLQNDEN
jgi:hypothetical protein